MKKFAYTFAFVILVVLIFASVSAAVTTGVDPATKVLPAVGNTFNIDVVIDDVTDLGGFEFELQYDPSIVTIENSSDVSLGAFLGSTGRSANLLGPSIDNTAGLVKTGAFSFGAEAGPNGSGILIKITFTVQSKASGALDLKNVILTDTSANSITVDTITDGNLITTANQEPTANAGPDQTVFVDDTVTLDGSGSSDVDGDPLTYQWSFVSRPGGSGATLSDTSAVNPTFGADFAGNYVVQLIVNDGTVDSDPDTVTIAGVERPTNGGDGGGGGCSCAMSGPEGTISDLFILLLIVFPPGVILWRKMRRR